MQLWRKRMTYWIANNKIFFHFCIRILPFNLWIINKAIAVNTANTSKAWPELPKINWTKANIIQTTNQTNTNIINFLNSFLIHESANP